MSFLPQFVTSALLALCAQALCLVARADASFPGAWLTSSASPSFTLVDGKQAPVLHYDAKDYPVVELAVADLARDLGTVSGLKPSTSTVFPAPGGTGPVVLVGTLGHSALIDAVAAQGALPALSSLRDTWEGYVVAVVEHPLPGLDRALVIAGSDRRGTAFGVYQLSQAIGVSPWYWWAEVPPTRHATIALRADLCVNEAPKVRYRGIFLNDEAAGMAPWSKETHDPEHPKAIGPKTYARLFELMLRLRSNYLWPAVLKNSGPLSAYPENRLLADRYAIVIGSQHSEPLSSYGAEWHSSIHGEWNYFTNKKGILSFLEERVSVNKAYENIYTLGLRGINDVAMEGNPTLPQQAAVLEEIIQEERAILSRQIPRPVESVPQILVLYKEVMKSFSYGFKLPEDVTLVWAEDNYGYIKQLPSSGQSSRSGGNGVYYHLAYLGRPFDYDWLSGTNTQLLLSEMKKAAAFGADRVWVFNSGDIKAVEYDLTLAMDIAWSPSSLTHENLRQHQVRFFAAAFGPELAERMADLRIEYEQLAFSRRPEHMSWSRLEQTRLPTPSEFSWTDQREAELRLARYAELRSRSQAVLDGLRPEAADAYWHLLHYRIAGAEAMNRKWLLASRHDWHTRQGRSSAYVSYTQAWEAFADIWLSVDRFTGSANNKWARFISMYHMDAYCEPLYRREPQKRRWIRPDPFEPQIKAPVLPATVEPGLWLEAENELLGTASPRREFPVLSTLGQTATFLEIYNRGTAPFDWTLKSDAPWLRLSASSGRWTGPTDARIHISLDPTQLPAAGSETRSATLTFSVKGQDTTLTVPLFHPSIDSASLAGNFVEQAGVVSIPAAAFVTKRETERVRWKTIPNLGLSGQVVTATDPSVRRYPDDWNVKRDNPYLEYRFFTFNRGWINIETSTLPTHPASTEYASVYAVALNDGPELVCNYATYQRDEAWMRAVESNRACVTTRHFIDQPGWQTLRLYLCDPTTHFDQVTLWFDKCRPRSYLAPAPTRLP